MTTEWTEEKEREWLAHPLMLKIMNESITNLTVAEHCVEKAMFPLGLYGGATASWGARYEKALEIQKNIENLIKELNNLCNGPTALCEEMYNEYTKNKGANE